MECWERNSGFHLLLASFSGNQYLYRMLKQVFRDCARAMTQYFLLKAQGKVDDEQNQYHERVIRALREKDLACAQELIKKDVYLSLDETMLKRAG